MTAPRYAAAEMEARAKRFDRQCRWCYGHPDTDCSSEQCHKDAAMLRQAAAGPKRCGTCRYWRSFPAGARTCVFSGVMAYGDDPRLPADGSGFCHLHEAHK